MQRSKLKIVMIILALLIFGILFYDNFRDGPKENAEIKAKVLKVDNSEVIRSGITGVGYQSLVVRIVEGKHKGKRFKAINQLTGKAEIDNFLKKGDKILVAIKEKEGQIIAVKVIDLYRQGWQLVLFGIFILLLIIYARAVGVMALFSFVASLYVIWKFLIPGLLAGYNPLLLASLTIIVLTAIIIFSIAGLTKKGLAAFIGTVSGLIATIGITVFFGNKLALRGMTAPFSQVLLFSGHMDLNMKHIFYASIVIGASGAAMDIAMDVAASVAEIKDKSPDIEMKELIQSGFNVGRAVIGTMTTTLLLAYSGGYLTLLMLFSTRSTSLDRMINFKMVTAEVLRTLAGSIGLVLVAPLTAILAGWIYSVDLKELVELRKD
ncbi:MULTISPECIES: YibE/F family protein [unclassified Candidatus Frackibacter]|uniref:YibE/F family protein n=1 Tax=unclassified Candidatus Frackibacter TaxID=2648818 RepID=UPI0008838E5A|nr:MULTISPECIES: YibE/F family protein [unclassified Candidatus Frackibacter]SDC34305.1 Uncharacterized membrane protein [Candidatus Frackibacter sp. WG11]SEM56946.1 Uncharacterized membrane protein [Candidatus Frackibacter sp. WG12]SFL70317.1 Uncharacterized membrane protein [Candidatus Frackibacter sp. WG13]